MEGFASREEQLNSGHYLLFKGEMLQICRFIQVKNSNVNGREFEIIDIIVFLRKHLHNILFIMCGVCAQRSQDREVSRFAIVEVSAS